MNYANNQPMADASYTLNMLSRRFADRGLAACAKMSSRRAENRQSEKRVMREYARPTRRSAYSPSETMTISNFENKYRAHSEQYSVIRATAGCQAQNVNRTQNVPERRAQSTSSTSCSPTVHKPQAQNQNTVAQRQMRNVEVRPIRTERRKTAQNTAVVKKEKAPVARRAVGNEKNGVMPDLGALTRNFRHLPVATILVVVACAVSLMFIVGSSVMLSDASNELVNLQNEVAGLAKEESELSIALEMKNNLRTVEDIAVNKLGMVNKDLVTKQYISLSDNDIIENYDSENTNVGLSALLSAISGGN